MSYVEMRSSHDGYLALSQASTVPTGRFHSLLDWWERQSQKKTVRVVFVVVGILKIVWAVYLSMQVASYYAQLQDVQQQLHSLHGDLERANAGMHAIQSNMNAATSQVANVSRAVADAHAASLATSAVAENASHAVQGLRESMETVRCTAVNASVLAQSSMSSARVAAALADDSASKVKDVRAGVDGLVERLTDTIHGLSLDVNGQDAHVALLPSTTHLSPMFAFSRSPTAIRGAVSASEQPSRMSEYSLPWCENSETTFDARTLRSTLVVEVASDDYTVVNTWAGNETFYVLNRNELGRYPMVSATIDRVLDPDGPCLSSTQLRSSKPGSEGAPQLAPGRGECEGKAGMDMMGKPMAEFLEAFNMSAFASAWPLEFSNFALWANKTVPPEYQPPSWCGMEMKVWRHMHVLVRADGASICAGLLDTDCDVLSSPANWSDSRHVHQSRAANYNYEADWYATVCSQPDQDSLRFKVRCVNSIALCKQFHLLKDSDLFGLAFSATSAFWQLMMSYLGCKRF